MTTQSVAVPPTPSPGVSSASSTESKQKQIYTFESKLPVFSIDWSHRKDQPFRLAFSSFEVRVPNKITVVQLDDTNSALKQTAAVDTTYPQTKVMWMPYSGTDKPDLFASTGDLLRIWEMKDGVAVNRCSLKSVC